MQQFSVVRITKDDLENKITKGQIGTILDIYDQDRFEVEICDSSGKTLFLGTLSSEWLKLA